MMQVYKWFPVSLKHAQKQQKQSNCSYFFLSRPSPPQRLCFSLRAPIPTPQTLPKRANPPRKRHLPVLVRNNLEAPARHSRTHHAHGWRHAVAYQDALLNNSPLFVKSIVISGACDQNTQRQQFFRFHGHIFLLFGMGPVPCAVGRCAPQNKTHRHVEWDVSCIIQRSIGGVCSQSRRFYI